MNAHTFKTLEGRLWQAADKLRAGSDARSLPKDLLKIFAGIPATATGNVFGRIYEYFLSAPSLSEGQDGGEFFTPH